jgi:alginate O-acetyltransferase complex protein AlgI
MLFNSLEFLIFAALFFGLWPLLRRKRSLRWAYLIAASSLFYGWWDYRFLLLLIGTGFVDFLAALGIERHRRHAKWLVGLSLSANLGVLAVFKYGGFFAKNLEAVCAALGHDVHLASRLPSFLLVLPPGISFYTFQSMSYTIDVYRGHVRAARNPLHFFAYLSLFPQLVAGPIVRATNLLPQLLETRATTEEDRWQGLTFIVRGYFKKVVIADHLATVVNRAFSAPSVSTSSLYWWVVVSMFAFQIYYDFSGYTDIARGLAKWMGYDLPVNFANPYRALSLREFWGRWHISLSTWFRDYVYVPLGGNRGGALLTYRNLWVTMLLSGLWHGAAWTFLLWSAVHAAFLSIERLTRWPERLCAVRGGRFICWALVLVQVWVAWVFFRAPSVGKAFAIVSSMFASARFDLIDLTVYGGYEPLLFLGLAMAIEWTPNLSGRTKTAPDARSERPRFRPLLAAIMIVACVYLRGPGSAFIYFQF